MSGEAALHQAADLIHQHDSFVIMSHVNPDADAIGSSLGLSLGLRALGKDVRTILNDSVPDYARFLPGSDSISCALPATQPDAYVFADAAGIDRVGALYEDNLSRFAGHPMLNVDHHRTNPHYGTVNYVVPHASSTSELVYRLLKQLEAPIDAATATALFFGVVGDTGSFRNGATTPGSLQVAAHLLELGADTQSVAFHLFECKTFAAARLWGHVVSSIELDRQRHIVFACMSQDMLLSEGATVDEAEGIAEYLRGISEAEVVMLLKETDEGRIRISMRSRPAVDASAIASSLGGGGHRQAAGCTIDGPFENAKRVLTTAYDALNPR